MTASMLFRHIEPPDTLHGGPCRDQAALMNDEERAAEAIDLCMGSCRVYAICLAWIKQVPADNDPGGVIAGMTEAERTGGDSAQKCSSCLLVQPLTAYALQGKPTGVRKKICKRCNNAARRARQAEPAASVPPAERQAA